MTQAERLKLRAELVEQAGPASALAMSAERAQAPFARAFHAAHERLAAMSGRRSEYATAEMLAAYDARVEAGHAWYPSRQRHKDMAHWHTAIMTELRAVNQDIERAANHADRSTSRQPSRQALLL